MNEIEKKITPKLIKLLFQLLIYLLAGKTVWEVEQQQLAKVRSLADKWREVSRRIELWVDIQVHPFISKSVLNGLVK